MSFYRRSDVVYGFSASALGRKFFRLGGLTFYLQAPFLMILSPAARKSATIRAKKKEGGPARAGSIAGPPSQPGRMPLSRQLYQLGQYLMHPIPQSLLPPGYILQVGVVNAPGFMRTAGQLV